MAKLMLLRVFLMCSMRAQWCHHSVNASGLLLSSQHALLVMAAFSKHRTPKLCPADDEGLMQAEGSRAADLDGEHKQASSTYRGVYRRKHDVRWRAEITAGEALLEGSWWGTHCRPRCVLALDGD